jgi:hypothetical protein
MRVTASISRAAAAVGDMALFDEARSQVHDISRDPAAASAVCSSLLEVVYGSVAAEKWELAEHVAQSALEVATSRGEVDIVVKADALLKTIASRIGEGRCRKPSPRVCGQARTAVPAATSDKLAERLIRSIVATDLSRSAHETRFPSPLAGSLQPSIPSPLAQGPHSVARRCPWSGSVSEYVTYEFDTDAFAITGWVLALNFQAEGPTSFNRATRSDVPTPHVHDRSMPGGTRAARPGEIPAHPW